MDPNVAANTSWVLISTAVVLLMTPALGLFYGGLVRRKNVLSTLMYSFCTVALISLQWVLLGYTLSFGPSESGLIGGLQHVGLEGVGLTAGPGETISPMLFMAFQMTFAIITPALISGAFVERKRFGAFVIFTTRSWAHNPTTLRRAFASEPAAASGRFDRGHRRASRRSWTTRTRRSRRSCSRSRA